MPKKSQKIEAGAKFGKLKIVCLTLWGYGAMCVCQCECSQIVKVKSAELETKARTACLNCESKNQLKDFKLNDIAIYQNSIGKIPFGEQVIVTGHLENSLEIEYRGRAYQCRPTELEKLGINFYDRRRAKKIR